MAQLMPLILPFWYWLTQVVLNKWPFFWWPNPRLTGVQCVLKPKLFGVIFKDNLKTDSRVSFVLRTCDQHFYLLKQLRDQGLSSKQLDIVFQSIVIMRIAYTTPVWSGFVTY